MKIKFIEKDQIWQNETTNYWFDVDGQQWAISDCNGELTLLDCDGCPADQRYEHTLKPKLVAEYEKHIND